MSVTLVADLKDIVSIRLTITTTAGENIGSVMRTAGGATRTVRVESGQLPSTAAAIVIHDYEYPLTWHETIRYTVYSVAGTALASTTINSSHPLFNTQRGLLSLTVPLRPASGFEAVRNAQDGPHSAVIVRWANARAALSTLHTVVGRADPIPVLRPMGTRTGSLDVVCPSLSYAQEVERVLAQPYVFLLRQSDQDSLDLYFVVTSVNTAHGEDDWHDDPQPERQWTITVGFTEVAWPTGPVVPPTVWTYADVLAGYGDYNAVMASFSTYANLLDKNPIP